MTATQEASTLIAPEARESIRRALHTLKVDDFDGHTEFQRLSVEERLIWISQIAFFIYEFCGIAFQTEV